MAGDAGQGAPAGFGGSVGSFGTKTWSVPSYLQVKAALTGALFPNVAVMSEDSKTGRPGWNDGVAEVALHPASLLHPLDAPRFGRPFLVYLEKASPLLFKFLFGGRHIPRRKTLRH